MNFARFGLLAAVALGVVGAAPQASKYEEGQVWEYRTRPVDKGSLLRIQKIETHAMDAPGEPIYHISVIDVHFQNVQFDGVQLGTDLEHLPVTRSSLDASVTKRSASQARFPDANNGIAEWRAAKGGFFTVPMAEVIGIVEKMLQRNSAAPR